MRISCSYVTSLALSLTIASVSLSNGPTLGPAGVNSTNLGLNGAGFSIGQVEPFRPGDPQFDPIGTFHNSIDPVAIFRLAGPPNVLDSHPHSLQVAGVMISREPTLLGVAPNANLFASAFVNVNRNDAIVSTQHIARQGTFAVSHSYGFPLDSLDDFGGNSQLTLAFDWSARQHNVLHVIAGNQGLVLPLPKDNFNGITVAASARVSGVWRKVAAFNTFDEDPPGFRTGVSLLAPGDGFTMLDVGNRRFPARRVQALQYPL